MTAATTESICGALGAARVEDASGLVPGSLLRMTRALAGVS